MFIDCWHLKSSLYFLSQLHTDPWLSSSKVSEDSWCFNLLWSLTAWMPKILWSLPAQWPLVLHSSTDDDKGQANPTTGTPSHLLGVQHGHRDAWQPCPNPRQHQPRKPLVSHGWKRAASPWVCRQPPLPALSRCCAHTNIITQLPSHCVDSSSPHSMNTQNSSWPEIAKHTIYDCALIWGKGGENKEKKKGIYMHASSPETGCKSTLKELGWENDPIQVPCRTATLGRNDWHGLSGLFTVPLAQHKALQLSLRFPKNTSINIACSQ